LALAGIGAAVVHRDEKTGVDEARDLVRDVDRWATAEESANTMVAITIALRREAEACATKHSAQAAECRPLFAGSAHAQGGSIGLLRCSRVEVFDARDAMDTYLRALQDDAAKARLPVLPYCT
jgi:hypothetical protein